MMRMCNLVGRLIFVEGMNMDEIPSLFSNCGFRIGSVGRCLLMSK